MFFAEKIPTPHENSVRDFSDLIDKKEKRHWTSGRKLDLTNANWFKCTLFIIILLIEQLEFGTKCHNNELCSSLQNYFTKWLRSTRSKAALRKSLLFFQVEWSSHWKRYSTMPSRGCSLSLPIKEIQHSHKFSMAALRNFCFCSFKDSLTVFVCVGEEGSCSNFQAQYQLDSL